MTAILQKYIGTFRSRRDLTESDAEIFLDALIDEIDETTLAAVFREWNGKGISSDEIYLIAKIMRGRCTRVSSGHSSLTDIVGTGGSKNKTFNVSTAAAFVAAGYGLPVAKHGNRAATSNSGSADVLSELGVEPAVDASTAERCLREIGICFMFAPNFHRLSPTLAKVRRGLGFPTIFNCVGPLCNPAGAGNQLIGVWSEEMVGKMADALARLGTQRSWIVHGLGGLDEISISTTSRVAEINGGDVRMFDITPSDFGIEDEHPAAPRVANARESADLIRAILDLKKKNSAGEDLVLINAAAALFLSRPGETLAESYQRAKESLYSGQAKTKLTMLADAVRR